MPLYVSQLRRMIGDFVKSLQSPSISILIVVVVVVVVLVVAVVEVEMVIVAMNSRAQMPSSIFVAASCVH